jgi:hypothetical protein
MRTSESKELQQLINLSSGFEFEVPVMSSRDTDRNFKFAATFNLSEIVNGVILGAGLKAS